ncbi:unnamed protein product [marine sediment metagenome]|uniref:Uncharacterized protein n=1 Tax=marine sediment metagenome TaxID=412755 RepID=X1AV69_9ZZZZ
MARLTIKALKTIKTIKEVQSTLESINPSNDNLVFDKVNDILEIYISDVIIENEA